MAELEIHHEGHEHGHDPMGKNVGVLAAIFAVLLAVVTILSHRAHTESVMQKSNENDTWAYFQAKKIKLHNCEIARDTLTLLAPKGEATEKQIEKYKKDVEKYEKDTEKLEEQGNELKKDVDIIEKRAFKFDLGEGLLEIALVMSSLYFIAKKALFPGVAILAGLAGIAFAIYGLMM